MREIGSSTSKSLIKRVTIYCLLSPAFSKKSGGTLFLAFRGAWRVVPNF